MMDGYRLFRKDRQRRRGGVVLYVKENLECIEFNYANCENPIECLWVKIRRFISKGDLTVGICYRPPNQDDKANKAVFGSLKQASGQQNLVLMGDFNYPDICWKKSTAAHMLFIKFLEYIEDCFLIQMACRDAVRKAKAQLELKLTRDIKNYKKGFFRYINNKQKQKENIGPLLNRRDELVTNSTEKAKVPHTFFNSVLTTVGPQALGTKIQVDANTDPLSMKEELVCELLQELDPYKSMGPDNIHPRVLREVADIIVRPLSIIFEKSWRSGDIPEDWKKANVTLIYKKGLKEDPGNYRPISLTSVLGKVLEQILLGAITSQMKHVIGKSQHRFTKDKLCLINAITFYNKVTCSVDVGQAVDIVYLDFSKVFSVRLFTASS
ncbi:mitochondrial enolase superfamily member 1 [Grus japonensis]|uniref:Mitochondrial enolase superfamily member 1 n=1 Tax=Grus japonensis TaxID=30415 RepID=A0ABC9Y092_GRUJA